MRKHFFLIQKLLLFLFYIQSMVIMQAQHKQYFWLISVLVAIVSFTIEGARPYTPIFLLIFISDLFDMTLVQTVLIVFLGFLMVYIKFYQIEIVGKGPYNSGYRIHKLGDIQMGIFYPSTADGSHCKWIPTQKYSKDLYDIFYSDPRKSRIHFAIFKFLCSYLYKIKMPVLGNASLYIDDSVKEQKWKMVVFSHGLGSNMTNYSCFCGWWASHGYIVVSPQHDKDQVRIKFGQKQCDQPQKLERMVYGIRNRDLLVRTKEYQLVLDHILNHNLLQKVFPEVKKTIGIEQMYLSGQSYGGSTILQALANFNIQNKRSPLIKGLICMDAWFFPLSPSSYQNLNNQNIFLLNSQTFIDVCPWIYYMKQKMNRIRQSNKQTIKAVIVKKTDHISTSDFAFAMGNIMKMVGIIKYQQWTKEVLEFHEIAMSLFMEGKSVKEMLEVCNEWARKNGLMEKGIYLEEEWRYCQDRQDRL